jgi:uncharacterized protein
VLRGFDWLLQRGINSILRVNQTIANPSLGFRCRTAMAGLLRLVVLFGVGLPYVMAAVLTYRPKVELKDDPRQQLGYAFEPVWFRATDGTRISAWWIPAQRTRIRGSIDQSNFGENTVLICHGLGSNKSNQLVLSRGFVPYGYNVLIFDFRAHGGSGGQLCSFGDLERRDVLGAVRYLRANRADQSRHIYGVGASMGAAALIAAAADPSPDGRAIDAIAAYGTYDSVQAEMEYVARDRFIAPLRWVVDRFGLPMASAQVGADLLHFAPAELVRDLWPRPIMVVHGMNDNIIDFNRGVHLFNSALQPKQRLWVDKAGHNELINDDYVAKRVREFFQSARPMPII